jgi:hypothetical protein
MLNSELKAVRLRLKLSRPQFTAMLKDPATGEHIKSDTLYRWERTSREVFELPSWVERAVVALETKFARYDAEAARVRAKNPRFGDERYDKRGAYIYDGETWSQLGTWYASLILAKKKGEPLPLPQNEWQQPIYDKIFHRVG